VALSLKSLLGAGLEEPLASVGLLTLRLGCGISLLTAHAIPKLSSIPEFADFIALRLTTIAPVELAWLSTLIELVAAPLIIVGAATRLAALPLILNMLVATCIVHLDSPWSVRESAALYLIAFSALLGTGPGRFSLDHWQARRRRVAD